MTSIYEPATLFDSLSNAEVAQIALNGTLIKAGAALPFNGRMRSFKLLNGNLRSHWGAYQTLQLTHNEQTYSVRIAALPSEVGATGFIEFMQ